MAERARRAHPWRRRIAYAVGLGFLLLVGLVILALPFRSVQGEGDAAKADLERGADALRAGDIRAANDYVVNARAHVDRAMGATHGIGGDVWQYVPVAGSGVSDVRHLVEALDDATAIAEIGVDVYSQVLGDDASVVDGTNVDMQVLSTALDAGREAAVHARAIDAALGEVSGTAPVVGDRTAAARDEAVSALQPVTDMLDRAEPLMDVLPRMLGAEEEQKYLVAILNPAELRYSGGANTALAVVRIADGRATFRDIGNLDAAKDASRRLYWKKVKGNPFHPRGKTAIQNATWSPYWSVSGEEILRAWAKVTKEEFDGFIAIDVPAIASLVGITGSIEVPEVGTLDESNLTKTLVGSYDIYDDIFKRRALNRSLIPIFREKLFAGGQFIEKFQALGESAKSRHFAAYFRDPDAQAVITDLGVDGDLSDTDHDYVGVFSQNTNMAKSDYWMDRTTVSAVSLRPDGSADVELTITSYQNSDPWVQVFPDPKTGYLTRWSESALAVFLPKGVDTATVTRPDGTTLEPFIDEAQGRPFLYQNLVFAPQSTQVMTVRYRVPEAAEVRDGSLVYRLDADPQGMVTAPKLGATVTFPRGYRVTDAPAPWRARRGVAELDPQPLVHASAWEIVAARRQ